MTTALIIINVLILILTLILLVGIIAGKDNDDLIGLYCLLAILWIIKATMLELHISYSSKTRATIETKITTKNGNPDTTYIYNQKILENQAIFSRLDE